MKTVGSRAAERAFLPSLSSEVGKEGQGLSEVIREGSQEQVMLKITSTCAGVGQVKKVRELSRY